MPLFNVLQSTAVSLYATANRLGLFSGPLSQRLLRKAYFQYKERFEDPYIRLTLHHPGLFAGGSANE